MPGKVTRPDPDIAQEMMKTWPEKVGLVLKPLEDTDDTAPGLKSGALKSRMAPPPNSMGGKFTQTSRGNVPVKKNSERAGKGKV